MLLSLSIHNVAVIERAEVEFSDGFNILTGETGAGKSILMDALSMALGMRTSKDLIRTGADHCSVSALFYSDIDLSDIDIEPEEDGSVLLSRSLSRDGKNICKINSKTVPLSLLRQAGERLVNIHGQNDNIALLKPSYHLSVLDEFALDGALLEEYEKDFLSAQDKKERLENMKMNESEREMEKDMLSFRINEIKTVSPTPDEDTALGEKRDALKNFSSIMLSLETAYDVLSGTGDVIAELYKVMTNLSSAASVDKSLLPYSETATDLYYNAQDVSSSVALAISRMSFSPEELDSIEERLDLITRLKKKYGPSLEDVLNNLSQWEEKYNELLFYEDNIALYEKEYTQAYEKMLLSGQKLHQARLTAAERLSSVIESELSFLNMPSVKFDVKFTSHEPSSTGLYNAEFMISTNPSEDLKPLNKIASGGEMSRIMLALKSALSACADVDVLIFDEIDSGVSGKAAVKISEKLKALAENRQIICITHLPQLASKAHSHLLIEKDTSSDAFRTNVTALDYEGRIKELTRLIAGDENTSAARLAAIEMLDTN